MRAGNFLSGLAVGLLDDTALVRLTISSYDRRGTYSAGPIKDWEVEWFARDLPPPPARILVGAAGSGREVSHLEEQGYQIVAFEPAPRFVANVNQAGQHRQPMLLGSYEDLLDPSSELSRSLLAEPPFEAILLGWGSITHLPGQARRREVFRRLRTFCPHGPLLASFVLASGNSAPGRSRARTAGHRLATLLGGRAADSPTDGVSGRHGYAHWFNEGELADLAEGSGYRIANLSASAVSYPHATFVPTQDDPLEQRE